MAGPNYLLPGIRKVAIAVRLLRVLCRTADHINNMVQDSSLSDAIKTASGVWHGQCEAFCEVVEVAYQNLPDA